MESLYKERPGYTLREIVTIIVTVIFIFVLFFQMIMCTKNIQKNDINHQIIYELNDGQCDEELLIVKAGESSWDVNCSKEGFELVGFTIIEGDCQGDFDLLTGICSNVQSDMRISVNWHSIENFNGSFLNILYDANGGECQFLDLEVEYGESTIAPICERQNYIAKNYEIIEGNCAGLFDDQTGVCEVVNEEMVIKVNWVAEKEEIIYSITYDSNGGNCQPASQRIKIGANSTAPNCYRDGYQLIGFTRISGSGGSFNQTNGRVTNVVSNQTIRAEWEKIKDDIPAGSCLVPDGSRFYGDLNNDGTITTTDRDLLSDHVLGFKRLDDASRTAADLNNDGNIDIQDLTLLQQYLDNVITKFPVCN